MSSGTSLNLARKDAPPARTWGIVLRVLLLASILALVFAPLVTLAVSLCVALVAHLVGDRRLVRYALAVVTISVVAMIVWSVLGLAVSSRVTHSPN